MLGPPIGQQHVRDDLAELQVGIGIVRTRRNAGRTDHDRGTGLSCCFRSSCGWLAALITWLLVTRLLIRPLTPAARARSAASEPAKRIRASAQAGALCAKGAWRPSFSRATVRVDEFERDMAAALDGQRRLVREVHHRVKNNLQVVASLLNIHGAAPAPPKRAPLMQASGGASGRLSIVHRNHFAEMEENCGIGLRTLLTELASELRAGAPESARRCRDRTSGRWRITRRRMRGSRRLSGHGDHRVRDAPLPRRTGGGLATRVSELTLVWRSAARSWSLTKRATRQRPNLNALSAVSPSSCDPRSSAASAGTALICQSFRANDPKRFRYGCNQKSYFEYRSRGTQFENAALCTSDSDLLPPRSRYPIKWARNRQPSPPPVAFPGPLLSGPLPQPLS